MDGVSPAIHDQVHGTPSQFGAVLVPLLALRGSSVEAGGRASTWVAEGAGKARVLSVAKFSNFLVWERLFGVWGGYLQASLSLRLQGFGDQESSFSNPYVMSVLGFKPPVRRSCET